MVCERIYQKDVYCEKTLTRVSGIREENGFDCIACESSVFFPEGGGQPSDFGTVSIGDRLYNVLEAFDEGLESELWHRTDAPAGSFSIGAEVELTIDWDNRFLNMQRHCGEHMLSGTMHRLFGGVNRGFHMGEDYITIDIDIDGKMLTDEELDIAERTVNEAIWEDLPVEVKYFEDYEASLSMPVRKAVPHEGRVSVVTVGSCPDPFDCIACCGTHPDSSAQVGLLAIYKHEPNKGMNRIYFDCGIKAKERLSSDYRLLTELANRYSCSTSDILHRLELEQEEISALKGRLAAMSAYIREAEAEKIFTAINSSESETCCYELDLLSVDDMLKLGFAVIGRTENRLLLLSHPTSRTVLLFSSGAAKCGALVKAKAAEFGGRGGGRDDNARAVFADRKSMKQFAEAVSKMV